MQLVRFLGMMELIKYMSGETLENHKNWRALGNASDSVGFCFFDDSQDPEVRLRYIAGQCDISFVATFAVNPLANTNMRKSVGKYRDPNRDKVRAGRKRTVWKTYRQDVEEYSMERYNNSMLILKKLGKPYLDVDGKWKVHDIDQAELEMIITQFARDKKGYKG